MRQRQGNSIVEAVVAVSLVLVGITGIVQLATQAFRTQELVASRFVAAHLAAEGVEIVKGYLDGSMTGPAIAPPSPIPTPYQWVELDPNALPDGAYEVSVLDGDLGDELGESGRRGDLSWRSTGPLGFDGSLYTYGSAVTDVATRFTRTVLIAWAPDCEYVSVQSIVSWTERNASSTSVVADRFYSWRGGAQICNTP